MRVSDCNCKTSDYADRMRRFIREAKAAAALNHPNIAHVYEIGQAEGAVIAFAALPPSVRKGPAFPKAVSFFEAAPLLSRGGIALK